MWMFKKEEALDSHNWHATIIDRPGNQCFFNWRLEQFQIGFHISITSIGIDYYIGLLASLHGCYIWNKEVKNSLKNNHNRLRENYKKRGINVTLYSIKDRAKES